MGTGIEWTDETWNPVTGCTKVSPGCDHCYAETITERFHGKGSFATVKLHPERLDKPLRWRKPRKVFVNSMSDLFHDDVPDEYIADVWHVMAETPQHTYQILTKRHARMRSWVRKWHSHPDWSKPLPHVWLGVSVENQQWAGIRIPALLDTPAAVRFLSCEPLLGPLDLARWTVPDGSGSPCIPDLHWVIVGGESGHGARPMHPDWARSLRDQCMTAGVPFHFKQHGVWAEVPDSDDWRNRSQGDFLVRRDGKFWPLVEPHGAEDGTEVLVRRMSKHHAGRELDGCTWDEFPEVS